MSRLLSATNLSSYTDNCEIEESQNSEEEFTVEKFLSNENFFKELYEDIKTVNHNIKDVNHNFAKEVQSIMECYGENMVIRKNDFERIELCCYKEDHRKDKTVLIKQKRLDVK